jgi:hypothetical protein
MFVPLLLLAFCNPGEAEFKRQYLLSELLSSFYRFWQVMVF